MSFVLMDRDGVINHESNAYIKTPDEWLPIPGSLAAIAALTRAGRKVIIATNQSGIARGFFDREMLEKIHQKLHQAVAGAGGTITDILFCPHHPDDYCACRKPQPGLFTQIKAKYAIDLTQTYYIGDSVCDMEVAQHAGCKPLLVLTGNGQKTLATYSHTPPAYFKDLAHATEFILNAHAT